MITHRKAKPQNRYSARVSMSKVLADKLKKHCVENETTESWVLRQALKEYFNRMNLTK